MVTTRWTLTLASIALGALAAIDVHHGPMARASQTIPGRASSGAARSPASGHITPTAVDEVMRTGEPGHGACPSDMAEVTGDYCPAPEQICEEFISEKRDRCERFRQTVRCIGKTTPKHFCVDRYEYPIGRAHV